MGTLRKATRMTNERGAPRRGRVLLVDDEPLLITSLLRLLGAEHEVVAASTAAEALALLLAGERFDVVLCDVRMPGMNGLELYERLRETAPDVTERIVFFTGAAFASDVSAFFERVDNELLEKPFDPPELRALVRRFTTKGPPAAT
jgi:CheY-like chemotaxis protein